MPWRLLVAIHAIVGSGATESHHYEKPQVILWSRDLPEHNESQLGGDRLTRLLKLRIDIQRQRLLALCKVAVLSGNSNRPTFMLPSSSSSLAIRLTALDIQRSLHLAK